VFEMLAGDPPFLGDKINVILGRHLREPVPALPADVPPALVELVHALLAKQADARPQSAHVVRQRLAAVLAGEAPDDEAPTLIHTPRVARGTEPPPPATPPAIRSTLRHSPPPPAPVQTAAPSHKTEILPNPPRRLLPFVLMVLVLAIAAFVAAVIALGP